MLRLDCALLLTDLDNTIYNWVDFFSPSFRGMVHALAREMGTAEPDLIADFRRVFIEKGSVEYAFSVQRLESVQNKSHEEVDRLVRIAKSAFSIVRTKNLKPYEGVAATLATLRKAGVLVVGTTNSPIFQAEARLRQLRLLGHFDGLAAWEGYQIPDDDPFAGRATDNRLSKGRLAPIQRWQLPREELKPHPRMYEMVLRDLAVKPAACCVVGDSLAKDVQPGLTLGASGIWAHYGGRVDPKNWQTLLSITNWDQGRIEKTYSTDTVQPTARIGSFCELSQLLDPPQRNLFSNEETGS